MLKEITINLNAIEHLIFFWQSVMDGEKVSEFYLADLASIPELSVIYDATFTQDSCRKVLSAITNHERLNTEIAKERQFWNKNMYLTEEPALLSLMIQPIKVLNLNGLVQTLNDKGHFSFETLEIIFIPAFTEDAFQQDNRLYINFFNIMVDLFGGTNAVTIEGQEIPEFIFNRVLQMQGVTPK